MVEISKVIVGQIETNCYFVVNSRREALIVDPGAESEKIIKQIKSLGIKPVAILNTHGHYDHILAATALQQKHKIPIYFPKNDNYLIAYQQLLYDLSDFKPDVQFTLKLEMPGFEIEVIPTPGHTKGSSCLLIDKNLFSGDMLFADGYLGRTDLWGGSAEEIQNSLAELMKLPDDVVVYPGHGPSSTIGQERKNHGR